MSIDLKKLKAQISATRSEIETLTTIEARLTKMRQETVQKLVAETSLSTKADHESRINSIDHGYRREIGGPDAPREYDFWSPVGYLGRLHIPARLESLKQTLASLEALLPTKGETLLARLQRDRHIADYRETARRRSARVARFQALLHLAAIEAKEIWDLGSRGNHSYHAAIDLSTQWDLENSPHGRTPLGAAWSDANGAAIVQFISSVARGHFPENIAGGSQGAPILPANDAEILLDEADAAILAIEREFTGEDGETGDDTIPPPSIATGTPVKNLSKIQASPQANA